MMIDPIIFGIIGLSMLLLAFVLNSFKKISRGSYEYNALNCIGAFALTYYAITLNSLVFIVLESIWGVVALYFIIKRLVKGR